MASSDDSKTRAPQVVSEPNDKDIPEGWAKLTSERKELWASRSKATLLEWALPSISILFEYLSFSHLRNRIQRPWWRANFLDIYALTWSIALTFTLFRWAPHVGTSSLSAWAIGLLAGFRAFDIFKYRIYFLLVKGHEKQPHNDPRIRRRFVFAFVNFYEVVVAYATLYLLSGSVVSTTLTTTGKEIRYPVDAMYFSLVTMATVGFGDYVPNADPFVRGLVIAQIATSLVLLLFIIPTLVSLFSAEK